MNRSILIVICDFLLVSLLAFSTVDINKVSDQTTPRAMRLEMATNQIDSGKDLTAVMRLALDDERKSRDRLVGELTRTREAVSQQQALLTDREKQVQTVQQQLQSKEQLSERLQEELQSKAQAAQQLQQELQSKEHVAQQLQQELQTKEQAARQLQQQLQAKEQAAQKLQQELESKLQAARQLQQALQTREDEAQRLAAEQTNLVQRVAAAQTNLQALNQQLHSTSVDSVISKEQSAALEAEVRKQADQSAALQKQLDELAKNNRSIMAEKQQLATQLQVTEAEKRFATAQVVRMLEEVKVEREEKAKLAEGVKALATRSGQLAQEIRETRPLGPNFIYSELITNRIEARFEAFRSGLLGADKRRETTTVLVNDGTHTFALCHVQDTPLTLFSPGTEWEALLGTLGHNTSLVPIRSLAFYLMDPRIVLLPVAAKEAQALGCKVYRLSSDPYKFQDAVLVGTREDYYGECKFELDPAAPDYLKLDRNVIKGLFGKFNPSRGDLVFSRMGELIGVMANGTYCLRIRNFEAAATFQFGQDVRLQHTAGTLSLLYLQIAQLPSKLQ